MALSKYERVYVAKFCDQCGKEDFEGFVFGEWRTRHLQAESGTRKIICDRCRQGPKLPKCHLSPFFTDVVQSGD